MEETQYNILDQPEHAIGIRYGGFWERFAAAFIDGIIVWIAMKIISLALFTTPQLDINESENPGEIWSALGQFYLEMVPSMIVSLVINWLYFAYMESSENQATIGKMALNLKVTDLRGERISFGRATGRFFSKYVSSLTLLIGYIMAAFTERKQALHDMIAGTLVMKK